MKLKIVFDRIHAVSLFTATVYYKVLLMFCKSSDLWENKGKLSLFLRKHISIETELAKSASDQIGSDQSLSRVRLFATP